MSRAELCLLGGRFRFPCHQLGSSPVRYPGSRIHRRRAVVVACGLGSSGTCHRQRWCCLKYFFRTTQGDFQIWSISPKDWLLITLMFQVVQSNRLYPIVLAKKRSFQATFEYSWKPQKSGVQLSIREEPRYLTHVVVWGGEAVRVVHVIATDVVGHGGKEGDETDGDESLAREVALSPVNLLWWVGAELALKHSITKCLTDFTKTVCFSSPWTGYRCYGGRRPRLGELRDSTYLKWQTFTPLKTLHSFYSKNRHKLVKS